MQDGARLYVAIFFAFVVLSVPTLKAKDKKGCHFNP
jgi:hypothetical protein